MKDIDNQYVPIPGFGNNYLINRAGKIWSNLSNKILSTYINQDGYYAVGLIDDMGLRSPRLLHRLLAITFIKNPDKKPVINHINGVKTDNRLDNLEWATVQENTIHAYQTGLQKPIFGENHGKAIYDNEQIHQVCSLLESGVDKKDIKKATGVSERSIIAIQDGVQWRNISMSYDIPSRSKKRYSDEEVHRLCVLLERNPLISNKELAESTGISESSISSIRNKETRLDISTQYDIKKPSKFKYSDEEIHNLCQLIEERPETTNTELSKVTGINRRTIGNIKNKKSRIDISKHYNF